MSGRKLGGGRVLGSGKGLAPAPPPSHISPAYHQGGGGDLQRDSPRAGSPFDLSDVSTVSSGSNNPNIATPPTWSSPLADFSQDLSANISLDTPSPFNVGGGLVCPICQEEMMTLLQLNRHLDDTHQELPEIQQNEVKSWFDKQVLKARRFQPLSILNQKLRGLEVFESNEEQVVVAPSSAVAAAASSGHKRGPSIEPTTVVVDPDDLIIKKHWQRTTGNDICTDPACDRRMGPLGGSVHCRKCGRLFCEEHTMYQVRLAPRTASHDPVRGYWYRVCETCYKSREGYNDHAGVLTDHTAAFESLRRARVDRQNLEIARLETRLTRLTQLLVNPPEELLDAINSGGSGGGGGIAAAGLLVTGQKNQRKAIERSVVIWEDDAAVTKCPFCQQQFGSWTFRRHHCRICGRVVCADPQTGCSSEIGLSVSTPAISVSQHGAPYSPPSLSPSPSLTAPALARHGSEKPIGAGGRVVSGGQVSVDIRMCRDCSHTIFSKRDVAASIAHRPPDQRAYENLRQFERGIRSLMPSFQRALLALQPPEGEGGGGAGQRPKKPLPTHAQIKEAGKIRKRLLDAFAKYNLAARRLRDLPTESPTQKKLQLAVYAAASGFLHINMLPLKSVPTMLKSSSSQSSISTVGHRRLLSGTGGHPNGGPPSQRLLSPLRNGESARGVGPAAAAAAGDDASSVTGSEASTVASALEVEEKEIREKLVVLEEQRFLVQGMISSARGSKRFEEVGALTGNLDELDREIAALRSQVLGVEERWDGLYSSGGAAATPR